MESICTSEQEFAWIATDETVRPRTIVRKLVGSSLLFVGAGGFVVSLPLLVLEIALTGLGLHEMGFALPYPPAALALGSMAAMVIFAGGSYVLQEPGELRERSKMRSFMLAVGVYGIVLASAAYAVALTWNHFGRLSAAPIPLVLPMAFLAASILLSVWASAPPRLHAAGARQKRVGWGGRLLTYSGWGILLVATFSFPAIFALVYIGFASEGWILVPMAGVLIGPMFLVAGLIMISPRKKLVLFLRRFGNEDINRMIRQAVRRHLGSTYRLITLDDLSFRPASSPPGPKALALGTVILTILLAGLSRQGIMWTISRVQVAQAVETDVWKPGAIDGMEGWYFEMFLGAAVAGVNVIYFCVIATGIAGGISLWLLGRRNHLKVASQRALVKVERYAKRLTAVWRSPRLFAPQAIVVKVADDLWKSAVESLLRRSHVALVDISVPSESILWELQSIRAVPSAGVVLLAQRDHLAAWIAKAEVADTIENKTLAAARSLPMLSYSTAERLDVKALVAAMSK